MESNLEPINTDELDHLSELELVQLLESMIQDYTFMEFQGKILWENGELTKRAKLALDIDLLELRNRILRVKAEFSRRDRLIERTKLKIGEVAAPLVDAGKMVESHSTNLKNLKKSRRLGSKAKERANAYEY